MMDGKLGKEYENLRLFLAQRYNIELEEDPEEMDPGKYHMIRSFLYFLLSLKIWEERLSSHPRINAPSRLYFQENVSNIAHAFLLTMLELKLPAILMLRRTQENLLHFFYYKEHEAEASKKERNADFRPYKDFAELKEYIVYYPFRYKYSTDPLRLRALIADIIETWGREYGELSRYVHGSNTKYFSSHNLMDAMAMSEDDFRQMDRITATLSSILNSLMMIFFFSDYREFDENTEKHFIRCAIANEFGYKRRLTEIFYEI